MADDVERSSSNSKVQLYFENAILIFVQMLKVHTRNLSLSENYSEQYYCFYKHLEKPSIVWACANAMPYLMFCCNNNNNNNNNINKKKMK